MSTRSKAAAAAASSNRKRPKAAKPASRKKSAKAARGRSATAVPAPGFATCDVCGTSVSEQHCRFMCPKCGAMRDCSDP